MTVKLPAGWVCMPVSEKGLEVVLLLLGFDTIQLLWENVCHVSEEQWEFFYLVTIRFVGLGKPYESRPRTVLCDFHVGQSQQCQIQVCYYKPFGRPCWSLTRTMQILDLISAVFADKVRSGFDHLGHGHRSCSPVGCEVDSSCSSSSQHLVRLGSGEFGV